MNKSLWLLLLLLVLLTARTEMNRPEKPVRQATGQSQPTRKKPATRPGAVPDLKNSLSMNAPEMRR
jgi:hypothetical protein